MPGKRISVRIDEELRQGLEDCAAASHLDESEIVRQAMKEFLAKREPRRSAYDLLDKAGLIGIFDSGPKDLSTNRKYFEDLGRGE